MFARLALNQARCDLQQIGTRAARVGVGQDVGPNSMAPFEAARCARCGLQHLIVLFGLVHGMLLGDRSVLPQQTRASRVGR